MTIVLEYMAMMKLAGPPSGGMLALPDGASAAEALAVLGIDPVHRRHVATFVNGRRVPRATVLREGDRLFLSIPVGGG